MVKSVFSILKLIDLLFLVVDILLKLLLLPHELMNGVVLTKRESRSLLHNFVKFGDLILESLDDLSGFFLFLLGSLNKFPAFLDLSSENSDGVGIFLGELDSSLDSSSIL